MITQIKNKFHSSYLKIISSIAFYPTLITAVLAVLALVLLNIEDDGVTKFLNDKFPALVIASSETARTLLGTLIGGIISLTVFSFSMVMILLNQASSNFSPRLLPGLISDKLNQTVLGVYLGTIIYNIIVLISIETRADKFTLNGFTILFGILLGMVCLCLFVYFIHSISTNIQISFILKRIFNQTKDRLIEVQNIEREQGTQYTFTENEFKTIQSDAARYYQGVNLKGLCEFVDQNELTVKIIPYMGQYILPNQDIIKYKGTIDDEDSQSLNQFLIYSSSLDIDENYILGLKQITEVGLKAMSPGINDPGTAIITLDYITELLALRMQISDREIYATDNGHTIELTTMNFSDLLYQTLASYRQYCKHDAVLMNKMIEMLQYLNNQSTENNDYQEEITKNMNILKEDIQTSIKNKYDLEHLENKINSTQ